MKKLRREELAVCVSGREDEAQQVAAAVDVKGER